MSTNDNCLPNKEPTHAQHVNACKNSTCKNHFLNLSSRVSEFERIRKLLNLSQDLFLILDINTLDILDWNVSARDHLKYPSPPNFREIDDGHALKVLESTLVCFIDQNNCQQSQSLVTSFKCANGTYLPVELTISIEKETQSDSTTYAIIVARDITERLNAEKHERQATAVLENMLEAVLVIDSERKIQGINPFASRIMGYTSEELIGQDLTFLLSEKQGAWHLKTIWNTAAQTGKWQGEVWMRDKNGRDIPFLGGLNQILDDSKNITQYLFVMTDITKIIEAENHLAHVSNHDPLTQLPNRLMMTSVLDHAIRRADKSRSSLSLILLDVDRFKSVNDTLGHKAGDQLLQAIAERILVSAPTASLVAHISGDEFAILLENTSSPEVPYTVAHNVLSAFKDPVHLDGFEIFVSLAIGLCHYPEHGQTTNEIFRNSDSALHHAKSSGGNQINLYTPEITKNAFQNLQIETSLRQAIDNRELELFYQPQFDLYNGRLCGAEALVRWLHPTRGIISPAVFIPRAEETGLIIQMGEQLLLQACEQINQWLAQGLFVPPISVNVSGVQFSDSPFVETITKALQQTNLDPALLKLEITESFAMSQGSEAIKKLNVIRDMGVELSIDDFGTGYSSLAYLRDLPVTSLKIDREFIRNLPDNEGDCAITKAIIAMSRSIGLQVVAEGVETSLQQSYLQSIDCDIMQGYLGGRPIPASEFAVEHLYSKQEQTNSIA